MLFVIIILLFIRRLINCLHVATVCYCFLKTLSFDNFNWLGKTNNILH